MTPEQEKEVLELLEEYKRIGWLWRGIATLAKWISTVVAGTTTAYIAYKWLIGGK